jgi:uncharacterized protein YecE (DUF72 family)
MTDLPYVLGCPSWNEPAWREVIGGEPGEDLLTRYCATFNGVEGNTTFHALPSAATVERWVSRMPLGFRFCAKFNRDISHSGDLRQRFHETEAFLALLGPLGVRIDPYWLQLPATFGPDRLPELSAWLDEFATLRLAVEVRHDAFYTKGSEERALNRLLRDRNIERIGFDTRAVFKCRSNDPFVLEAQSRKPRLPVRAAAFTEQPQVRFVGGERIVDNEPFLLPWVEKVACWIEQGLRPHMYVHMPDNRKAAAQAFRFHALLSDRLPGLAPLLTIPADVEQLDLL